MFLTSSVDGFLSLDPLHLDKSLFFTIICSYGFLSINYISSKTFELSEQKELQIENIVISISLGLVCAYFYSLDEFSYAKNLTIFPIIIWSCLSLGVYYMSILFLVFINVLVFLLNNKLLGASPVDVYGVYFELCSIILCVYLIGATCHIFLEENSRLKNKLSREMLKNFLHSKNASMSKMAGSIAHEINNPLTIILGYSQMLLKLSGDGKLSEKQLESSLEKISLHSERINGIVKDMLAISKKQLDQKSGDSIFDTRDYAEVLTDKFPSELHRINIIDEIQSTINYPSIELSEALNYLVDNAIYFGGLATDKKVEVKLRSSDEHYHFDICDYGSGVKEELINHIYDPFFSTRKSQDSHGLGLSLASSLAGLFKGGD